MDIGGRLRKARVRLGLVIDDVASSSGLSRAYISQVETGKASPSIQTVQRLAATLGVSVSSLFVDDDAGCTVTRAADRIHVHFGEPSADRNERRVIQFLSPPGRRLEMVVVEIPARSSAMDKAHVHEGEEVCHVVEGEIEVLYGDEIHPLAAGDSIHWDSRIAHVVRNPGDAPAKVIIARTPSGLIDMRLEKSDMEEAEAT